ncbi:KAP family P-loop NTPase fold protein [Methanolobus halotolerans]|uniref:KAP NTPase domain-containing protein n=1 Tax=Methanolobus halotolerans TaxID=2052935 RepID=A0A4E0PXK9_9EURY|nr:P-loop NTPase fold protein [Methanolobus halotolerans]TGC09453.1 hypothetical protein CUN85_06385 [Methanolobus halotolerans]
MFNPDKAIISCEEDVLGRADFAKSVAQAICKDTNKDSHVIGFYGKWGTGKTSLINMVIEHIEKKTDYITKDEKPIIIKFNPWLFSNQQQLVTQFFSQFSSTLGREDNSRWLKEGARWLKAFSNALAPLSIVPGVGIAAFAGSTASGAVGEIAEELGTSLEKDLHGIKSEIHKLLELGEQRIIIVIDDIDRLNEIEIRQTFQLVKSLADFPNTTYILTFDREIVSKALEAEHCGYGKQYLEKIIQIPFELPDASKRGFELLLSSKLEKILADSPYDDFNRFDWDNIHHNGFKSFFTNIRDINRYFNVLYFNYELVKKEVNVIDFIAITAIQVFLPEVYNDIKYNKQVFAGIISSYSPSTRDVDKLICDDIIKKADSHYQVFLQCYLTVLFPKLNSIYSNVSYTTDFLVKWKKSRRICSDDLFDIYFRLALPEGKMSQHEHDIFFSTDMDNATVISETLLKLNESGKITEFLDFVPYTVEKMPEINIRPFITSIVDAGDLFQKDESIFYGTSMRIHRVVSALLKQIKTQDERFDILKEAFENSNQSLYTIVWLVDYQDELHGKYSYKESNTPENEQLITSEQLSELEQATCNKIKQWSENGKLMHSSHLFTILRLWERWDNGNKHQHFVDAIVSDNIGLSKLVESMQSKKVSSSSLYTSNTIFDIDVGFLKEFTGCDIILERILQIKISSDYDMLSEEDKQALDLCLSKIQSEEEELSN